MVGDQVADWKCNRQQKMGTTGLGMPRRRGDIGRSEKLTSRRYADFLATEIPSDVDSWKKVSKS